MDRTVGAVERGVSPRRRNVNVTEAVYVALVLAALDAEFSPTIVLTTHGRCRLRKVLLLSSFIS